MITNRKTAAQRQYDNFLSAVREFDCNSNEEQFERTLARLVIAHWETKRSEMQPSRNECERAGCPYSPHLNDLRRISAR